MLQWLYVSFGLLMSLLLRFVSLKPKSFWADQESHGNSVVYGLLWLVSSGDSFTRLLFGSFSLL